MSSCLPELELVLPLLLPPLLPPLDGLELGLLPPLDAVVLRKGFELLPPAALVRSKVAVPMVSCCVIVAEALLELRAEPER